MNKKVVFFHTIRKILKVRNMGTKNGWFRNPASSISPVEIHETIKLVQKNGFLNHQQQCSTSSSSPQMLFTLNPRYSSTVLSASSAPKGSKSQRSTSTWISPHYSLNDTIVGLPKFLVVGIHANKKGKKKPGGKPTVPKKTPRIYHIRYWFATSRIIPITKKQIPSRGTNISHLGKRKIIFKMPLLGGYVSSLEGSSLWAKPPILVACF